MFERLFSRFRSAAGSWRETYDSAADAEAARMNRASDAELLDAIRQGKTGEYYPIWKAIGSRRATPEVCWTLYDVLRGDRPYLDRYHCAAALLQLLGSGEFEAVQLSADWPQTPRNVSRLEAIVTSRVGPRRGPGGG